MADIIADKALTILVLLILLVIFLKTPVHFSQGRVT